MKIRKLHKKKCCYYSAYSMAKLLGFACTIQYRIIGNTTAALKGITVTYQEKPFKVIKIEHKYEK